ncbi:MAG: hypothetical protein ACRDJ9_33730 [Dehalococcoidia bacterium]
MSLDHPTRINITAVPDDGQGIEPGIDLRRCWGCRNLWPRSAMRWGSVTEGPLWYPRAVRVLRCPDCLA